MLTRGINIFIGKKTLKQQWKQFYQIKSDVHQKGHELVTSELSPRNKASATD